MSYHFKSGADEMELSRPAYPLASIQCAGKSTGYYAASEERAYYKSIRGD